MQALYVSVIAGAVLAGFVQGLSGFAFGLVAMSVWAWTLEPQLAALLALFGALTGQVIAALTVRRAFDKRVLWPFVGTIPTLWCTLRGFQRDTQRAVIQNFNLSMLAVAFAIHLASGSIERSTVPLLGVVALAVAVPVLLGARLYVGISEAAFRKLVLSLLTASGVAMLASAVPAILQRS